MTGVPLRRLFDVVNGGTPTADEGNWGGDVAWATPVDIGKVHGGVLGETDRTLTEVGLRQGSRAVPAGSLVLSTRAPIGYVAETLTRMAFNQGCRGLHPIVDMDIRFFRYQLAALTARLQSLGLGSTFVELTTEALSNVRLAVPAVVEQRAIGDFLDAETARIDALLTKKQVLLRLVVERSTVIINETVLRAAGSPTKVKHVLDEVDQRWGRPESAIPLLSVSIKHGVVPRDRGDEGQSASSDLSAYKVCRPGDIVLNRMRAFQGGVGVADRTGLVSPDYAVLRSASSFPGYLHYLVRSDWFVMEMTSRLRGIGDPNASNVRTPRINVADLGDIVVSLPSRADQERLANGLDLATGRLTELDRKVRRQLDLFREHRQALITAAVTGQMDVPGVAA